MDEPIKILLCEDEENLGNILQELLESKRFAVTLCPDGDQGWEAFKNEIPDITKIIIAQRISSVKDADKIIVLDDGKISGIGVHEELIISNSIYKEVHDSQEEGGKNNE